MASDLTTSPWSRLFKLCPIGTPLEDIQEAANRYEATADINASVADLWEEAAQRIDVDATANVVDGSGVAGIQSVSQDGVTVQYARGVIDYSHSQRLAQYTAYMMKAKYFRSRKKIATVALHSGNDNDVTWLGRDERVNDRIIPISNW